MVKKITIVLILFITILFFSLITIKCDNKENEEQKKEKIIIKSDQDLKEVANKIIKALSDY